MAKREGPKVKIPAHMRDVLRGYRYLVTLNPSVPLEVLQKAGEFCPIDQPCPYYGDESLGIWNIETKSLAEILGKKPKAPPLDSMALILGQAPKAASLDSQEWRSEVVASFLGQVAYGAMLNFLKSFRAIIEGSLAADAKRASVQKLCEEANASDDLDGLFTDQQVEYLLSYCN